MEGAYVDHQNAPARIDFLIQANVRVLSGKSSIQEIYAEREEKFWSKRWQERNIRVEERRMQVDDFRFAPKDGPVPDKPLAEPST